MSDWDRGRIAEDNDARQRLVDRAQLHLADEVGAPKATTKISTSSFFPGEHITYRGIAVRCGQDFALRAFRTGKLVATAVDDATMKSLIDDELEARPGDDDCAVMVDFDALAEWCARRGLTADAVGDMVMVSDRVWRLVDTDRHRFERLVRAVAVR